MDAHRDDPATKKDLDLVRKDLDQVKQELTDKVDANGRKIDANGRKIDANSAKIDQLICRVLENGERLDDMFTKAEIAERFDALLRGQDEMMVVLTRVDRERVATTAWIRRVEGDVETNKGEIEKIKTKLAMET